MKNNEGLRELSNETNAAKNTDREIWRGKSRAEWGDEDRYYADSLFVPGGEVEALGINCGGSVVVKPIREWHRLAGEAPGQRVSELSWRVLADAIKKHKPDVSRRFSLAELMYITRDLNASLAAEREGCDHKGKPTHFGDDGSEFCECGFKMFGPRTVIEKPSSTPAAAPRTTVTEIIAVWRSSPDNNDDAALASRINYAIVMGWLPFTNAPAAPGESEAEPQGTQPQGQVVWICSHCDKVIEPRETQHVDGDDHYHEVCSYQQLLSRCNTEINRLNSTLATSLREGMKAMQQEVVAKLKGEGQPGYAHEIEHLDVEAIAKKTEKGDAA